MRGQTCFVFSLYFIAKQCALLAKTQISIMNMKLVLPVKFYLVFFFLYTILNLSKKKTFQTFQPGSNDGKHVRF